MKNWTIILTCLVALGTLLIFIYLCGKMEVNANSPSVLISALGVMITFVVAWQIWQTIDTKDTIKELKKKAKVEAAQREKQFGEYAERLSLFNFASNCVIDAFSLMSDTHHVIRNNLFSARNVIGFNEAYCVLLGAALDALKAKTPETGRLLRICFDNMDSCLSNAEYLKNDYMNLKNAYEKYGLFNGELSDKCEKIYKEIVREHSTAISHEQHIRLKDMNTRRKNLVSL